MFKKVVFVFLMMFAIAAPVMAQGPASGTQDDAAAAAAAAAVDAPEPFPLFTGGFGAGLVLLGAAYGIGKIGASAVESMARQPEVADKIQTAMIIAAALIEGATFFGLIVCMLFNK